MLYLGDKKATLFKGDRRPVSLYLGDKKVTGYEYAEQTGEHLDFEGTYNDTASVVINGKSEQVQSVWATNLIENGDFNSGMSGWSYYMNPPQIISGRAYFERELSGEENIVSLAKHEVQTIANHRYYYSLELEQVKQGNLTYGLLNNTGLPSLLFNFKDYNPGNHKLSDIFTITQSGYFYINCTTESEFYIDNIIVIDLTETFGAGQEPSKEECDVLFADYFEGKSRVSVDVETYAPNSPSPNYPSPIKSVEPFDLVSCGKNLWDGILEEGYIDPSTGVNQNWSGYKRSSYMPIPSNVDYTFTCNKPGQGAFFAIYYDKNKNHLSYHNLIIWASPIKRTTPIGTSYIRITGVDRVIDNLGDKTKLEIGSIATPYTPFRGMSTVHFPYTLRSLPDGTRDYIEIDNINKTAKLYRNVGERILTATDEVQYSLNDDFREMVRFYIPNQGAALENHIPMCTYFIGKAGAVSTGDGVCISCNAAPRIYLVIDYLTISATSSNTSDEFIALFKNWLSTKNVDVFYKLTTPQITELDYNAVKTYYPYTQIYTTGSDISPDLDVTVRVIE